MNYTRIQARVTDQTIQLVNVPLIASGGMNEVRVDFNFCSKWDSLGKTAVFYQNPEQAYHVLLTEDSAVVPAEVLVKDGIFYFGVFGTSEDQVRTTEVVSMTIVKGAITFNHIEPSEPTPDIYQQLLAAYSELTAPQGKASVVRVKDTNGGKDVTFWVGTQAEYDALETKARNCMYIITDDDVIDYTTYLWESHGYTNVLRKHASGYAEMSTHHKIENIALTKPLGGFYTDPTGESMFVMNMLPERVVPKFCNVVVEGVTKKDADGNDVVGPNVLAMIGGEAADREDVGIVSPRILFISSESAENVTVKVAIHCGWQWKKTEEGGSL